MVVVAVSKRVHPRTEPRPGVSRASWNSVALPTCANFGTLVHPECVLRITDLSLVVPGDN